MSFVKKWKTLSFGRHKGETLPQVAMTDPSYLVWAMKNRAFKNPELIEQANVVKERMSNIAIPDKDGQERRLVFHCRDGRYFGNIFIKDAALAEELDRTEKYRQAFTIDIPAMCFHTKTEATMDMFLEMVRYVLFDDERMPMTAKRCNDFFNDPENFVLRCNLKVS